MGKDIQNTRTSGGGRKHIFAVSTLGLHEAIHSYRIINTADILGPNVSGRNLSPYHGGSNVPIRSFCLREMWPYTVVLSCGVHKPLQDWGTHSPAVRSVDGWLLWFEWFSVNCHSPKRTTLPKSYPQPGWLPAQPRAHYGTGWGPPRDDRAVHVLLLLVLLPSSPFRADLMTILSLNVR